MTLFTKVDYTLSGLVEAIPTGQLGPRTSSGRLFGENVKVRNSANLSVSATWRSLRAVACSPTSTVSW
jgi:hypothetical protein